MSFAQKLVRWQRQHGRHDLPWQGARDPYRVWLSEVMLQQTQVAAVIPYYERFLAKFPTVGALAAASEDDVLRLWAGLGYYARGRNLHAAAREIASRGFPRTPEKIQELPGIGRSTAAAIAVFAFGERAAILDANAKRVLSRFSGIADKEQLWAVAEQLLPRKNVEAYTQGLMDLGATVCKRNPACAACPLVKDCVAKKTGRVAELPAPRARKPLPLKRTNWYVCLDAGRVLLERRPSPGIWGGLWCFPEKAVPRTRVLRKLPPIDHGFTHFRLRIHPLLCATRTPAAGMWLDLAEAPHAAVPAPVKKLLQDLRRNATRKTRARR